MKQRIIEVRGLTKTYYTHERGHTLKEIAANLIRRPMKEIVAVKHISFTVDKGEMIAFLGPNGAGKSTTLKILSGVLYPTAGEVTSLGMTPWKQRTEYVRRIGAVFGQKSQLLWDIPPIDAFYMNKAIYGVSDYEYKSTLDQLVTLLNVGDVMRKPTRQLSLGERMKCEFIMAMLHQPELVFLDEPTIGLDVIAKEKIRDFIKDMNRQGVTFILTTHDLDDVERLAERVIVINHGERVFDDSLKMLRGRLGEKKAIRLTTEQPLPIVWMHGIALIRKVHEKEVELEIDTGILSLKQFIHYCNERFGISDMSIEPLPIQFVMKQLFMEAPASSEPAASS